MCSSPPTLARGAVFERLLEKAVEAEARARAARSTLARVGLYAPDRVERLGLQHLLMLAQGVVVITVPHESALCVLLEQQSVQVLAAPATAYQVVQEVSQTFAVPALYIARTLRSANVLASQIEQNIARSGLVLVSDDFVGTFTRAVQTLIQGESFIDPLVRDLTRQLIEATLAREPFGSLSPRLVAVLVLDQLGFQAQEICDYLHITPGSLKTYWGRIGEQAHLKRADLHAWAQSRMAEHADLWQLCSRFRDAV